jgi:hypothetical protein
MSKAEIGVDKESRTMYRNWPLEKEPTGMNNYKKE